MSNSAITWARKQQTGSPGAKAILLILADCANEDKGQFAYPCQQTLATESNQSLRSVRTHLVHLEKIGLIRRVHRNVEGTGHRTSDGFWLLVESLPANLATRVPTQEADVATRVESLPANPASLVAKSAAKPLVEPSTEYLPSVDTQSPPEKSSRSNPLWDALEVEWGSAPKGTPKHGQFVKAVDIYRKAGFTPEMVEDVHQLYQDDEFFGTLNYSIMAVANRAQELITKRKRPPREPKLSDLSPGMQAIVSYRRPDDFEQRIQQRNGQSQSLFANPRRLDAGMVEAHGAVRPGIGTGED
jgi:hypothetical protein